MKGRSNNYVRNTVINLVILEKKNNFKFIKDDAPTINI